MTGGFLAGVMLWLKHAARWAQVSFRRLPALHPRHHQLDQLRDQGPERGGIAALPQHHGARGQVREDGVEQDLRQIGKRGGGRDAALRALLLQQAQDQGVPHLRAVLVPGLAHGRHGGRTRDDEAIKVYMAGAGDDRHQFIEDQLQTLLQARLRRIELAQRDDEVGAQVLHHGHQQFLLAAEVAVGGGFRAARLGHDGVHADAIVAGGEEEVRRRHQQLAPPLLASGTRGSGNGAQLGHEANSYCVLGSAYAIT